MTFGDAIKTGFTKYADFNGRASKSEFWWFVLFLFLSSSASHLLGPVIAGLYSLAVLLPSVAAGARRLHDTDRSGWLQLIWFIPLIGWIILIIWLVQEPKEPNRFGSAPADPAV